MATTFDLPADLHEQVRAVAAAERRSLTQTLTIAVEEYVSRHQRAAKINEIGQQIAEEDAELLRRLA
jgi:predicted transcriptional regulator